MTTSFVLWPIASYGQDEADARAAAEASQAGERLAPPVTVSDSWNALPGLHRVANAELTKSWGALVLAGGYGRSGEVLDRGDSHDRLFSAAAVGVRPLPWLGIAVRVDQRFDSHAGGGLTDQSGTVDPRVAVRAVYPVTDQLVIGGELRAWIPARVSSEPVPDELPFLAFDAITPDAVLIASYSPLSSLTVSGNVGYRLDNSDSSVDDAARLSDFDRMDLGLSEFDAVLVGVGARWRVGQAEVFGEWSWDALLGSEPLSKSPSRFAVGGRWQFHPSIQLQLVVEASANSLPMNVVEAEEPLIPIEPRFQGLVSISFQRGGKNTAGGRAPAVDDATPFTLAGTVIGADGAPIANASVSVLADGETSEYTTDERGRFAVANAPRTTIEISVQAEGYVQASETVDAAGGDPGEVAIAMRPVPQKGQLRGVIQSFRGRPVKGTRIRIEPVGQNVVPEKGFFEIDLEPGEYTIFIEAPGYESQEVKAVVTKNAVKILNIDLKRKKRKDRRR